MSYTVDSVDSEMEQSEQSFPLERVFQMMANGQTHPVSFVHSKFSHIIQFFRSAIELDGAL